MQEKEKTKEEIEDDMEQGELDEDLYDEEGREVLIDEEDEITDIDQGFMEGYDPSNEEILCANCKQVVGENPVEQKIDGKIHRFCSSDCAMEFERKSKK